MTPASDQNIVVPRQIHSLSAAQARHFEQAMASWQGPLETLLLRLRLDADEELLPRHPALAGKPYPLGRCREIRDAVFTRLAALLKQSGPVADEVLAVLRNYLARGGVCRKVWGSLRDEYFQNAIQIGPWYVDVANDTVTVTKPKIEILRMQESGFCNIRDYFHFAEIAGRYWNVSIYANTVLPQLAPLLPLVCVGKSNGVWLAPAYDEMIELTRREHFIPSEQILLSLPAAPAAARTCFADITSTRADRSHDAMLKMEGDPVSACQAARAAGLMYSQQYRHALISAYLSLKQRQV